MTDAAKTWWGRSHVVLTWVLMEQVLPGAMLFVVLLWLSQRYLREGFGDVRQYAFAPRSGKWSLAAPVRRNWWSCSCAATGVCRCAGAIARGLRRCCVNVLQPKDLLNGAWGSAAAIAA